MSSSLSRGWDAEELGRDMSARRVDDRVAYFHRMNRDGSSMGMWKFDLHIGTATKLGVTNAEGGAGTYFKAQPGETIWDTLKKQTPWFLDGDNPFHETRLRPGDYYPRMARPTEQLLDGAPECSPGATLEPDFVAMGRGQLAVLTRQLDRICQTVHPVPATFSTFGHDIRNLLIISCTEVETHWRGVLQANGAKKSRYTTRDYVLLRSAMKLDDYAVTFP